MRSRHKMLAGMTAVCMAVGCQSPSTSKQSQDPQTSSDALLAQQNPQLPKSAAGDAADTTDVPDELALLIRKTEAHAKRIAQEMENRPAAAQQPQPQQQAQPQPQQPPQRTAAAEPSVVEWLDPQLLRLGPAFDVGARRDAASPSAQTERTVRGTANQAIAISDEQPIPNAPVLASNTAPQLLPNQAAVAARPAAATPSASQDLQRLLATRIEEDPRDSVAHLEYQLLRYIEGKQVPELGTLASLTKEDQEIVTAVIDALSNYRSNLRADSNLLLSRKIKPLMDLSDRLRAQADLEIPTVQLCRRVDGFGVYEPLEARFVAGRDREVIVYCEVANFMSQMTEQNQWETRLTEEVVLYTDADGLPILREKPVVVPDLCRNRRHDFFIVRKLRLPGNIPVGRYWLKVTIVDQLASRVAEASIPITFVAN